MTFIIFLHLTSTNTCCLLTFCLPSPSLHPSPEIKVNCKILHKFGDIYHILTPYKYKYLLPTHFLSSLPLPPPLPRNKSELQNTAQIWWHFLHLRSTNTCCLLTFCLDSVILPILKQNIMIQMSVHREKFVIPRQGLIKHFNHVVNGYSRADINIYQNRIMNLVNLDSKSYREY